MSGARTPAVSAVVVSHDSGAQLIETVARLKAQTLPPSEIVVVDSGSTDGCVEDLATVHADVRILRLGANLGPCVARNRGVAATAGAAVLMVDDDVYLAHACLARLVTALGETGAAAAVPRLALWPETDLIQLDGAEAHFIGTMLLRNGRARCRDVPAVRRAVGGFSTSCVLMRRDAFLDAGGFDEAFFFHFEDLELSLRLRALGHTIVCEAPALAYHARGDGTPGLSFRDAGAYPARRAYLTMRNRLQILALHYRLRTLVLLTPALVVYEAASAAFCLRRGVFAAWRDAWVWQVRNRGEIAARRRRLRQRRVTSDVALLVGGPPPLAEGLVGGRASALAMRLLAAGLGLNWAVARRILGRSPGRPPARAGRASAEHGH